MTNLRSTRQIRGDEEQTIQDVQALKTEQVPARGGTAFSKYRPYLGSDSLPSPTDGQKYSEPLYEVARSGRRYKLLRYRRGHYGVYRDVVRIMEPQNKNRPQDKILLSALKKAGIPGAH